LQQATKISGDVIQEFTVAPQVSPEKGLPYHEWFIEFQEKPKNLEQLAILIDEKLRIQNSYYNDLITGNILQPLKITRVIDNGFTNYMKSIGKLGGQNKLPRLANDRKIATVLKTYKK